MEMEAEPKSRRVGEFEINQKMNLTKVLRQAGYDLIDGPIRNHKLAQLWVKKGLNSIDFYYAHVDHAFKSDVVLNEVENPALSVDSSQKNEYKFNVGITLLDDILKSLGLGSFELSAEIKSGKKVAISYNSSVTIEYALGNVQEYFFQADFKHANPLLLKNANRDNLYIITGVVLAKNLVVDIETDFALNVGFVASLNSIVEGKLAFEMTSENHLRMVSGENIPFPIAVKAYRLDFDKGAFQDLTLVTDTRAWF